MSTDILRGDFSSLIGECEERTTCVSDTVSEEDFLDRQGVGGQKDGGTLFGSEADVKGINLCGGIEEITCYCDASFTIVSLLHLVTLHNSFENLISH